jgi:hypothetical protein
MHAKSVAEKTCHAKAGREALELEYRQLHYCSMRIERENISQSSNSANRVWVPAPIQSLPQAADINIDRAFMNDIASWPSGRKKLLACQNAVDVLHHKAEKTKLGRPQPYFAYISHHAMRCKIKLDIVKPQK